MLIWSRSGATDIANTVETTYNMDSQKAEELRKILASMEDLGAYIKGVNIKKQEQGGMAAMMQKLLSSEPPTTTYFEILVKPSDGEAEYPEPPDEYDIEQMNRGDDVEQSEEVEQQAE